MSTSNCIVTYNHSQPVYNLRADPQQLVKDLLFSISDTRPDQVLKALHSSGLEDQSTIKKLQIKCVCLVPHVAISISKIKDWMIENYDFFKLAPYIKKIIDLVQIPPNNEMQEIFDLFKQFAEPSACAIQLIGRDLWLEYNKKSKKLDANSFQKETKRILTLLKDTDELEKRANLFRCVTTCNALQSAIFGIGNQLAKIKLKNNSYCREETNKIWDMIQENEINLASKSPSFFYSYYFLMENLDHTFFVIQHRDAKDNIRYRILQSWRQEHSLHQYMSERGNDLSSEEFAEFANVLNHILFDKQYTNDLEIFYEHYFMVKPTNKIYPGNRLEVIWGSSDVSQVKHHKNEFDEFLAVAQQ